ncbi:hypothetical protein ACHMW4_20660 [Mesorhizobium sp. UC22_110]|uniref:hypothetical protein n=1 Tax=unclassified Mesorhizobium TaxID=325217 RepID=UPI0036727C27
MAGAPLLMLRVPARTGDTLRQLQNPVDFRAGATIAEVSGLRYEIDVYGNVNFKGG